MSATPESIANDVHVSSGLQVRIAPASLDAAVALVAGLDVRSLVLAIQPSRPLAAALEAAARDSSTTSVIAGSISELARAAAEIGAQIGPGRFVQAREWLLDPEATLYARHGAALVDAVDFSRPRSLAESPLPLSSEVRSALVKAASEADFRRYPPVSPDRLIAAIAARDGIDPGAIVVSGGGSRELVQRVLRTFTNPGDEVLARAPSWDALATLCAQEGLALRLSTQLDQPAARTRLVYVASPNNPDSSTISSAELRAIRAALPPDRVVILDEAYRGFDDEAPALPEGAVVSLRSFSKLEGLAGLRIGYAIAPPPLARLLLRFGAPYPLTVLAEEAAIAALADDDHRTRTREVVRRSRTRLVAGLRALGWEVRDSSTHVVLARPPSARLSAVLARAEAATLPLEECAGDDGLVQLTVPDDAGTDALLAALSSL